MEVPAKLGYAEINYGADLKKIVPSYIPGFWSTTPVNKIVYLREMNLFLEGKLNPKSVFYVKNNKIDKNDAIMHLTSVANSHLLNKRQKLAICGFLSSLWFKYIDIINDSSQK